MSTEAITCFFNIIVQPIMEKRINNNDFIIFNVRTKKG